MASPYSSGFLFNASSFLADCHEIDLTLAGIGCYFHLMCSEWTAEGRGIPDDIQRCANIIGCTKRQLTRHWPVIRRMFQPHETIEGRLVHPFLERERKRQITPSKSKLRDALLDRCGEVCFYCGATNVFLEIEHMTPRARGGTDDLENLTLACKPCNRSKGTQTAAEFRPRKTFWN